MRCIVCVRVPDYRTMLSSPDVPVTLIRPAGRSGLPDFRELWRARDLAMILAWRDVKVRYKQSLIGVAWAVLQPLLTMVVFTLVFGKFAQLPSQGLPYPVFSMLNLVPWTFLAAMFTATSGCVLTNRMLVQKVHFPLLILPLASVLVPLIDFAFSFTVALGITAWYGVAIQPTIVLVPVFLLMLAITAIGLGSFLAVINVRYRDVPYVVPFLVQLWLFASGVIYAAAALPEKYAAIVSLNPAVGAITGFRWAVAGTPPPSATMLVLGWGMAILLFVAGLWFYRRAEPRFADTL
jgi:lipopolysaccharide transport system permease protein